MLQVPVSSHVKVLGQLREALEHHHGQIELNVIHLKLNDGHACLLDLNEILNVRALRHGDIENSKYVGAQHILWHHHYHIHICTGQMHVEAIGTKRLEPEQCRIIVLFAAAVLLKGLPDKLSNNLVELYELLRSPHRLVLGGHEILRKHHLDESFRAILKTVKGKFAPFKEREIEKFIIRQPPIVEKDDHDSENS